MWVKTQQRISEQIKISWHKQKHCILSGVVCWESRLRLKNNILVDTGRKSWHFHTGLFAAHGSFPSNLSLTIATDICEHDCTNKISVSNHCPVLLWMAITGKYSKDAWKEYWEKNYMYNDKVAGDGTSLGSNTGPSAFLFAIREGQDRPLLLNLMDCFFALLPQLGLVKDTSSARKPWLGCKLRSSKLQQQEDKLHIVQM